MTSQGIADKHYEIGIAFFDVRRNELAEKEFKMGLALDPDHFHCLYALCAVLLNTGRHQEADLVLQKILHLYPDHYAGYYLLARTLFEKEQYGKSEEAIRSALSKDQEETKCWLLLAKIKLALRDPKAALESTNTSLALDPEFTQGLLFKLELLHLYFPEQTAELSYIAFAVLDIAPENAVVHHTLARYYSNLDDTKNALKHYFTTVSIDPNNKEAKREYEKLIKNFKIGNKGPDMVFGVEMDKKINRVFFIIYACVLLSLFLFAKSPWIKAIHLTVPAMVTCFISYVLVFPFAIMYFYLKLIAKLNPSPNPFVRRIDPTVNDKSLHLSPMEFMTINQNWNTKVITLGITCQLITGFLVYFLIKASVLSKIAGLNIGYGILLGGTFLWMYRLKFRQE